MVAAEFGTSFAATPSIVEQAPVLVCTSARATESRDFVSQSDGPFLNNGYFKCRCFLLLTVDSIESTHLSASISEHAIYTSA